MANAGVYPIRAVLENNPPGRGMGVNRPGDHGAILTLPAGNRLDRGWACPLKQGSPLGQAMARAAEGSVETQKKEPVVRTG